MNPKDEELLREYWYQWHSGDLTVAYGWDELTPEQKKSVAKSSDFAKFRLAKAIEQVKADIKKAWPLSHIVTWVLALALALFALVSIIITEF